MSESSSVSVVLAAFIAGATCILLYLSDNRVFDMNGID
jgi:hypothetical protein